MNLLCAFVVAMSAAAPVVGAPDVDSPPVLREKLETAIPEGIRLLEAEKYSLFLKQFVKPEDFKRITEKTPLEEFAKEFGEEKATQLLEALKSIQDAKPTLDADGKKATFELPKPLGPRKSMIWVKVEKHWYIQN